MRDILKLIDLQTDPRLITEENVGRKVAYLKPLLVEEEEIIPKFFVITTKVFNKILAKIGDVNEKNLTEAAQLVRAYQFPSRFLEQLEHAYKGLSKFSSSRVALRATVSAPGAVGVSFSGVFPTFLNIRGMADLTKFIKRAYAAAFSPAAFNYIKKSGLSYDSVSLAIMVQKMVVPEVSGVAYLMDPITHSTENITIEAVYGIGDVISKGEVNPDLYFVSRSRLQIIEKKVNPQFWMRSFVNDPDPETGDYTVKIELAKIWHTTPKLTDEQILKLAKIVNRLAQDYRDLIVEWVYSGGRFWILQVKGQLITKDKPAKVKVGSKDKKVFPLITGLPLSYGEAVGQVVILNSETVNRLNFEELSKLVKGKIVVASKFFPVLREIVPRVKVLGVVLDVGSPRSDAAFLLDELKVPAIGATFNATRILKDGQKVYMDAKSGAVYPVE